MTCHAKHLARAQIWVLHVIVWTSESTSYVAMDIHSAPLLKCVPQVCICKILCIFWLASASTFRPCSNHFVSVTFIQQVWAEKLWDFGWFQTFYKSKASFLYTMRWILLFAYLFLTKFVVSNKSYTLNLLSYK